jgi:hypothetical protein
MSKRNNWDVSYGLIRSFEEALKGHDKVEGVERIRDILFRLTLYDYSETYVLLLDEYTLGLAALLKALKEFPEAKYIANGANWNGYTKEAKQHGWDNNIGVFVMSEFLGSLNWKKEPIKFHRKDKDGKPIYQYKSA